MNFKQFLKESNLTIEDILKECEPFLREAKGKFIYRGVKNLNSKTIICEIPFIVYHETTRLNREPAASTSEMHKLSDEYMFKHFNIKARSQTIFATGSLREAQMYGTRCIILPRGDFKFIWSPLVKDLFSTLHFNKKISPSNLDELKYQDSDLIGAINSNNEIMIACKDYYLIEDTPENFKLLRNYYEL